MVHPRSLRQVTSLLRQTARPLANSGTQTGIPLRPSTVIFAFRQSARRENLRATSGENRMNGEVPEVSMGSPAKGEYVGESPTLSSIEERVKALTKKGWMLRFEVDWHGSYEVSGYAGDSNCPHPKEWDQKDGHGNSSFDSEGRWGSEAIKLNGEPEPLDSLADVIAFAERAVAAIVPGAPYPWKAPPAPKPVAAVVVPPPPWWKRFRLPLRR